MPSCQVLETTWDLGYGHKYIGTIVGIDGCVYGIPFGSSRIVKYDPLNGITSLVGEEAGEDFYCIRNGALGKDGCIIYVLTSNGRANVHVLTIDITKNSHSFVGNSIDTDYRDGMYGLG